MSVDAGGGLREVRTMSAVLWLFCIAGFPKEVLCFFLIEASYALKSIICKKYNCLFLHKYQEGKTCLMPHHQRSNIFESCLRCWSNVFLISAKHIYKAGNYRVAQTSLFQWMHCQRQRLLVALIFVLQSAPSRARLCLPSAEIRYIEELVQS